MRACGSISAILTAPGNAAPTRTLTDCCASTFPKGPISAFTAPTKLQPWPPPSTRGPERRLIGRRPQRRLTSFSYQPTKTALRRPLESAQYAAGDYRKILQAAAITPSMSRTANCWDNAPMESFFGTLKTELVHQREYPDRDTARRDLFAYIEGYYNRQRIHSAIGYITPEQADLKTA